MKIDLKKDIINKPYIVDWYKRHGGDIRMAVCLVATATMCPNITLAFYLADEIGYVPELINIIDDLTIFYKITEITGINENSPYFDKYHKS